jgi:hypothetical protein
LPSRGVQRLVRAMVGAANHMGDLEVDVVHDARQMERRWAFFAPQHHSFEPLGQAGVMRCLKLPLRPLALTNGAFVPVDPEPAQILEDRLLAARDVAGRVGVVDP